jgi:hypothetical protein
MDKLKEAKDQFEHSYNQHGDLKSLSKGLACLVDALIAMRLQIDEIAATVAEKGDS